MGGGPSSTEQSQISLQQQQNQIGQQETAASQARMAKGDAIAQPAIDFWNKIFTGDPSAMLKAAAPAIGNIDKAAVSSEAQIMNSMAPGAARDLAVLQTKMGKNSDTAATLSALWGQAPGALEQIAASEQGVALQQTGAGLRGLEGASSTGQSVMQADAARNQAKASMWGSLMGAAGTAAGGGAFGKLGGCWIAEAIYGVHDPRTNIARAWLNGPFKRHAGGRIVMWLYLRVGRQVAAVVRRCGLLRSILKPLFDRAVDAGSR